MSWIRRALATATGAALAATGVFTVSAPPAGAATITATFVYTGGAQTWTVPSGVTEITVDAYGAEGGRGVTGAGEGDVIPPLTPSEPGGLGGRSTSTLLVVPGEELQINVGGRGGSPLADTNGGFNGGGQGFSLLMSGATPYSLLAASGGGGGASDVRQGGTAALDRVVVAAGGGGAGGGTARAFFFLVLPGGSGGAGGGTTGETGGTNEAAGTGGTPTAGGDGGLSFGNTDVFDGEDGTVLDGGGGGHAVDLNPAMEPDNVATGGGGGGGWFGGGGGGARTGGAGSGGMGGGGGSSLGDVTLPGVRSGNGLVTITYEVSAPDQQPDAQIKSGGVFLGVDVYNASGAGQSKTKDARRNQSVGYRVRVQNDGTEPTAFTLSGPGSSAQFTVFYKVDSVNVSSAVVNGSYSTPTLAPAGEFVIVVKVKPNDSASIGAINATLLTARDGTLVDAVKARTKVVAG